MSEVHSRRDVGVGAIQELPAQDKPSVVVPPALEVGLGPSPGVPKDEPVPDLKTLAAQRRQLTQGGKATPEVHGVSGLPPGIKAIRRATPQDAEGIAAIQDRLHLRKLDPADHPENGWLLQLATPEQIRFSMGRYKDYWIAETVEGTVGAYQAVSHPRFISRPAEKHRFFGPDAERAYALLQSAKFIYMSQIAIAPEGRGLGWGSALQKRALAEYQDLPLVAHVGVFTEEDLAGWNGRPETLVAHRNNVASHHFHQKLGYVPVAWTSDLPAESLNSGLPPSDTHQGVLGLLYVHFREASVAPKLYVDPVQAVIQSPMSPEERDLKPWRNPFPSAWPDREYDVSFDEGMFVPNPVLLARHLDEQRAEELSSLRRDR